MPVINLKINGQEVTRKVESRRLLVQLLRDELQLTGTHVGCDTSQCGCCTVHLDGAPVKSCTVLAVMADGCSVTTIEGVSAPAASGELVLHPVQEAFRSCHALQCGFCTPGMVMRAIDICKQHPNADEATIRHELDGNLCRCTGYLNIVQAIKVAAQVTPETGAALESQGN